MQLSFALFTFLYAIITFICCFLFFFGASVYTYIFRKILYIIQKRIIYIIVIN